MTPDTAMDPPSGRISPSPGLTPSWIVVLILISIPVLFNAAALFPEVQHTTPSSNDQVFHYLFIERANQAITAGDNPFDHWLPELELGFPQFLYYQNLPHLAVVGLYRLLLQQVSLIRLLNLVRYLLMVAFPLTVYWSMRRMEFSTVASATGAAVAPMLSCNFSYGFDYNSYIWNGHGMFPQLCAMHLMFIGTACVRRAIESGEGFAAAIIASSAVLLSDLLYGYMFAIVVGILWLLSVLKESTTSENKCGIVQTLGRSTLRVACIAAPALLITAYQTVPFFADFQFLNFALPMRLGTKSIAMNPVHQTAAFVAQIQYLGLALPFTGKQLTMFFGGRFFDNNRLPIITGIVVVGILYAVVTRSAPATLALTMLAVWMVLLVPNPIRDVVGAHLLFVNDLPLFRFVSGVDLGAILTAGLGGECIWMLCRRFRHSTVRMFVPILMLSVLLAPVLAERWSLYQTSADAMEATDEALRDDPDLPQILSRLRTALPGRVYAGTRGNWGQWMKIGAIHLYDVLPIEEFETVMPWQLLSLNAPLLWELNVPSLEICRLFNIRYVIAPPNVKLPDWYRNVLATSRYNLYEVDSGGYMQLGQVVRTAPMGSSEDLFRTNSEWLASDGPAKGRFTAYLTKRGRMDASPDKKLPPPASPLGVIAEEIATPDSLSAEVTANSSAVLILKITYHPNWHLTIDGHEQRIFMVSPSFIGTRLTPGHHEIRAEYQIKQPQESSPDRCIRCSVSNYRG